MKSVEVVGVGTEVECGVKLTSDTPAHTCAHGVGAGGGGPSPHTGRAVGSLEALGRCLLVMVGKCPGGCRWHQSKVTQ